MNPAFGERLRISKGWFRLIGLVLLAALLWKVDASRVLVVLKELPPSVFWVVLLTLPQVYFKAARWRILLKAQNVSYGALPSTLSYFGSIFIGFLTPGRLGEFIKAVHVSRDCNISMPKSFSSVLADRLFDLYVLVFLGTTALLSRSQFNQADNLARLGVVVLLLLLPPLLLIQEKSFSFFQKTGLRLGKPGKHLFAEGSWLPELRNYLRALSFIQVVASLLLTGMSYILFYWQCFLLSTALRLQATFLEITYAVALGSLVALLPISISGLGTREAAIVAFLNQVPAEKSLGFSLLVFVTFNVAGGLLGSIAWFLKPAELRRLGEFDQNS